MRSNSSGPFDDDELLKTIMAYPFAGSSADLPDWARFVRGVAQLVHVRLKNFSDAESSHAVFLLHPEPPISLAHPVTRHFALDDGETMISKGMWFVGPNVVSAARTDLSDDFDAALHEILELDLGGTPAVTFRSTTAGPKLRFYRNGLQDSDSAEVIALSTGSVTLERVLELVDRIHETTLVTPSAHVGGRSLWNKPSHHHVASQVEVGIQSYLRIGLAVGLPECQINTEQTLVSGRLDLEIEELDRDHDSFERHAILELKVLRTFGSTGKKTSPIETENWILEGVDQAYTYREERGAKKSVLCCFDMRQNPGDANCFASAHSKAKAVNVEIRSWPLFPSAKLYRAWKMSQV